MHHLRQQYRQTHGIENMETDAIDPQTQQPLQYTQPLAVTQQGSIPPDENTYYVCTLCETPTKFTEYGKLEKHVRRFHSDFNQNVKGSKRKRIKEEEVFSKKGKWNLT